MRYRRFASLGEVSMLGLGCARLGSLTAACTRRESLSLIAAAADAGTSLEISARSRAPVFFSPQAVAEKRKPRGKDASEGACFMGGGSAGRTRISRKGPPILRVIGDRFDDVDDRAETHGCFSSCARFCSSCAMAARTDSSEVPPGTDLEEMAVSTERLCKKSSPNAGEILRRSAAES